VHQLFETSTKLMILLEGWFC